MRSSLVIMVLLGSSSFAIAQEHAAPLALSARFAKATFYPGQVVELLLSLRNSSPEAVQVAMLKYPAANYRLEIEDQQHQPVKPVPDPYAGHHINVGSGIIYDIQPRSERQFSISLNDGYELKAPGKYYVRAILLPTRYWVNSSTGRQEGITPVDTIRSEWAEVAVVRY